jgi:hypothetical protein
MSIVDIKQMYSKKNQIFFICRQKNKYRKIILSLNQKEIKAEQPNICLRILLSVLLL